MKSLVFTKESVGRLQRFGISDDWFKKFELPAGNHGLKRATVKDATYIIEDDLNSEETDLVVIALSGTNPIFGDGRPNDYTLNRIIAASASHFHSTAQISTKWRPYSEKDILSFYAGTVRKGKGARLHAQKNPNDTHDLFFFARTDRIVPFSDLDPPSSEFHGAVREGLAAAILSAEDAQFGDDHTVGIVLCERLPQGFVQGASLDEWFESKLTSDQRRFVELPYAGPVRLRGAAGTGKTLSLVIKVLRDGLRFRNEAEPKKLCFVAHSQGSVDLVEAISGDLIFPRKLRNFEESNCQIEIQTLYDLAHKHLIFSLKELEPISLDGIEGREWQYHLIKDSLQKAWSSPVLKPRFNNLDPEIKSRWKSACEEKDPAFIAELMNEFSCVIDAEKIRRGEETGERYVKRGDRPKWLLKLPSENDRHFVLAVHSIYRRELSKEGFLSIDEMISDFDSFLESNAWDRVREREGYDALFVDELHLFTALEKQTLQKLVKRQYDGDGKPSRPAIFMAYDIKQSPRDSFLDYFAADGSVFSAKSGLQKSELIELNKVFRYTPQIAEFLKDLDASFPAIDVPGEWNAYVGEAELPNASAPTLSSYTSDIEVLEETFKRAVALARKIEGGGRRIAVLCVSEEMFRKYIPPVKGRFRRAAYLVDSREATSNMRHVGKRFIFSMPEFVAGLQFHTVFLLHVDQTEAPESAGIGRRRQLISNTYLGASRAENCLNIITCEDRGGPCDILNMALNRHSLVEVAN